MFIGREKELKDTVLKRSKEETMLCLFNIQKCSNKREL